MHHVRMTGGSLCVGSCYCSGWLLSDGVFCVFGCEVWVVLHQTLVCSLCSPSVLGCCISLLALTQHSPSVVSMLEAPAVRRFVLVEIAIFFPDNNVHVLFNIIATLGIIYVFFVLEANHIHAHFLFEQEAMQM